jgi:hypothetical protein
MIFLQFINYLIDSYLSLWVSFHIHAPNYSKANRACDMKSRFRT